MKHALRSPDAVNIVNVISPTVRNFLSDTALSSGVSRVTPESYIAATCLVLYVTPESHIAATDTLLSAD
eukprot:CAMPEP_0185043890 /NCGR_PEP_ID=MMETSP1103-20130426/43151_1 /TAXON_ID=36769 /ORGANISM="Paraphysomonas bandaiensis, Strain Caron Lab Isolate" /LENGTH=68 /DNA_ID=CAMNT_0027584115 /DNA_START=206 /DNA_END=412 /DNA_ORIENTATION=+